MSTEKLPLKVKLGFGVCDAGGNIFFTAIGVLLLNYLTDSVGIAAGAAGLIVAIGKIWDAVTDPLVGYWSDKTQSRWGRRRPWILFGALPLMLTMTALFINPQLSDPTALFIWGVAMFCLVNTAYTVVNIPYNALTPELTTDYHERSSLNGYRFAFAVIGTMIGGVASHIIIGLFDDRNTGFAVMGLIFGIIMMVTALITFFSVREKIASHKITAQGLLASYKSCLTNKPFIFITLSFTLYITAVTIIMGVAIYYFKYVHHDESLIQMAMGIMLVTAFIFIPISVWLSKRIGKKAVFAIGMATMAITCLKMFFLGHLFSSTFSLLLMVPTGAGLGFCYAMPWAIVPDTMEYHYLQTGERSEGAFYGLWTFSVKMGQAISMGITGLVFSWVGYVANVAQSAESIFGIRMLIGPLPAIFFLLAIIALYFYPITSAKYEEMLLEIKEQSSQ